MKIFWAISFFLFIVPAIHAYEWTQLNEKGLTTKTVNIKDKKAPLNFSNLEVSEKNLTAQESLKKYPALEKIQTIVVIGDTGCRLKESKERSAYQDCNDPKAWPFPKIVESAANDKPDLIIHLGDYHYRENCTPGKPCEKMSSSIGYEWAPWELDFFQPMQKLMKLAPLIVVRGNHEDCNRAYKGYKLLLANDHWDKECLDYEPAQIIVLKDLALVNFDSSSISEIPFGTDDAPWIKRMNEINDKLDALKVKKAWLVTHKPLYGIVSYKSVIVPNNLNLRHYLEKSALKEKITNIFSGHIHASMLIESDKKISQIVLGNSGTALETNLNVTKTMLDSLAYTKAELPNSGFGYALLKRTNDDRWEIIFKDADGKELYKNRLEN